MKRLKFERLDTDAGFIIIPTIVYVSGTGFMFGWLKWGWWVSWEGSHD